MSGAYPLVRAALNPLLAVSCAGMAAAGGFLVYSGYWTSLLVVAMVFFSATLIFPFLMLPAAILGNLMQAFEPSRPWLSRALQAASVGWLIYVMATWGAIVFGTVGTPLAEGGAVTVAAMAWAVSGIAGPWAIFARGDRDNVFFTGLVLMLWAGAIVAALSGGDGEVSFWPRFGIIAGVMAAMTCVEAVYESMMLKKKRG